MRKVTREPSGEWRPIEEEMVCDGWLARVRRDLFGGRWRWSVTKLEHADRWPSKTIEAARARGYSGSRDRAREMARTALVALQKAEAGT
jgi:hypothetical protein